MEVDDDDATPSVDMDTVLAVVLGVGATDEELVVDVYAGGI